MFKGIEANIRPDGTVDMEPHELRQFEFVVASPHSLLRKSVDQTARMVGAVSQPGVCILGHPQGRRSTCGPASAPTGTRCSRSPRGGRWRSRSTARGIGRTCTTSWRRARSSTAASSRSTATRTRIRELDFIDIAIAHAQARRHSRRTGSSTTGRTSDSSSGREAPGTADVALRHRRTSGAALWLWPSSRSSSGFAACS